MNGFQGDFLRGALDVAPEGVVICEATGDRARGVRESPRSAASPATNRHDLVGKNLRMLQGDDRDQQELDRPARSAAPHRAGARAAAQPAQGRHGVRQRHADLSAAQWRTARSRTSSAITGKAARAHKTGDSGIRGLPNWVREDRLTGLASRYYFEDVLKRDFALAQRDKTDIALLLFDIDQLGPYNEIFDRAGGDAVVKRVARAIAGSFRRGTDIVGRWEGASVIVLMHGTQRRSRDPARHHGRAPRARTADPSSALARRNT